MVPVVVLCAHRRLHRAVLQQRHAARPSRWPGAGGRLRPERAACAVQERVPGVCDAAFLHPASALQRKLLAERVAARKLLYKLHA